MGAKNRATLVRNCIEKLILSLRSVEAKNDHKTNITLIKDEVSGVEKLINNQSKNVEIGRNDSNDTDMILIRQNLSDAETSLRETQNELMSTLQKLDEEREKRAVLHAELEEQTKKTN